jgi:spore maturation protein CgeB
MKVIFAALKYDYGDPQRGPSFEYTNFYDTLKNMSGIEVELWPIDELTMQYGKEEMNRQLLNKVKTEKPDLLFTFLFRDEFEPKVIQEITNSTSTLTLNWFGDDQWRFESYSKNWAPLYSYVATTDEGSVLKYKILGLSNVIKTQWACNHFSYKPERVEQEYDVTFIGQPHGNRKKVFNNMIQAGIKIDCFGYGWPQGRVEQEQMIKLFSASKINLNLANTSFGLNLRTIARVFLHKKGRLVFPNSWSETKLNFNSLFKAKCEQMKGRNFEVPGCGGFLLTSYIAELPKYYKLNKEVVVFKNTPELIEKIKYYLKNSAEREAIARAGYERTIKEHTYEQRFREIFKTMELV